MVQYTPGTALLVIDVQNDFADAEGSLSVQGGTEVIAAANREIHQARAGGAQIYYSQDWHPEHTPHFATDGGVWPVHCVAGTWGAAFAPGLEVQGEIIRKGSNGEDGYSAFTMRDPESGDTRPTELHARLQQDGIAHVVVVGLATDYCVKATALDALALGYETTVLRHAVRAVDLTPGDGEAALLEVVAAGGIVA